MLITIVWAIVAICFALSIMDNGKQSFCRGSSHESKIMLLSRRNLACLAYGRALQTQKQFVASATRHKRYNVVLADSICDNVVSTRQHYLTLQAKCIKLGYIKLH